MISVIFVILCYTFVVEGFPASKANRKGLFILQDFWDGLCFNGTIFSRCSNSTLFYVLGVKGAYQIHLRASADEADKCINVANDNRGVELSSCFLGRPTMWDILGNSQSGYIFTDKNGRNCFVRDGNTIVLDKYSEDVTSFWIQLLSSSKVSIMDSTSAAIVTAAATNDRSSLDTLAGAQQVTDNTHKGEGTNEKKTGRSMLFQKILNLAKTGKKQNSSEVAASSSAPAIDAQTRIIKARDYDQSSPLHAAAANGHLVMLRYLMSLEGSDVHIEDERKYTPLMRAAENGHLNIVVFICEYNVDSSTKLVDVAHASSNGITALWLAAAGGYADVVKYLLDVHDSSPHVVTTTPLTSLQSALFKYGKFGALGAGVTALMAAVLQDPTDSTPSSKAEVVSLLVNAGAHVDGATNADGLTPLISACDRNDTSVVEILVKNGASLNTFSTSGFSPLLLSALRGSLDNVRVLMDAGTEVDQPHPESVTPLMYAAAGPFPHIVEYLIDHGANVNAVHSRGGSALMEAVAAGCVRSVDHLIDAGADVMIRDSDNINCLMSAASLGDTDVLRSLLRAGGVSSGSSMLDHMSDSGGTALMFAAVEGHLDSVKLLLEHNATVMTASWATDEHKAFVNAPKHNSIEAVEDMYMNVDNTTAIMVAAEHGFLAILKLLVSCASACEGCNGGQAVRATNEHNQSALALAMIAQDKIRNSDKALYEIFTHIAMYLLEQGANPDDSWRTVVQVDGSKEAIRQHNMLMTAVEGQHMDLALLLIKKGADIYYIDKSEEVSVRTRGSSSTVGTTALLQASHQGLDVLVRELLQRYLADAIVHRMNFLHMSSAIVAVRSSTGVTPLMAAAALGHVAIVRLLLADEVSRICLRNMSVPGLCSVNSKDVDGTTPLMIAANRGYIEVVKLLLDHRAAKWTCSGDHAASGTVLSIPEECSIRIQTQNSDGHTALMFAYYGKKQILFLMEKWNMMLSMEKSLQADSTWNASEDAFKFDHDGSSMMEDFKSALIAQEQIIMLLSSLDKLHRDQRDVSMMDKMDKSGHIAIDFSSY